MTDRDRPLILLTNDDGVAAPGIRAAREALAEIGEVLVAAPDRERSAASHSISLDRPLRVDEIETGVFSIDGTPVDCVYLALMHLVPAAAGAGGLGDQQRVQPRVGRLLFGDGRGRRRGGAARRAGAGAVAGAAAAAGLLARGRVRRARWRRRSSARGDKALPDASLLSVNMPAGPFTGYRVTFLGRRVYRDQVEVRQDLRGRAYYWIGGPEENATDLPGSDLSRRARRPGLGDAARPRPHARRAHRRARRLAGGEIRARRDRTR